MGIKPAASAYGKVPVTTVASAGNAHNKASTAPITQRPTQPKRLANLILTLPAGRDRRSLTLAENAEINVLEIREAGIRSLASVHQQTEWSRASQRRFARPASAKEPAFAAWLGSAWGTPART